MKEINDFGFSFETELEVDEIKDRIKQEYRETHTLLRRECNKALDDFRDMIMPLLNNLKKNPESNIIKWPNRVQVIDDFVDKIEHFIVSRKM